MKKKYFRIELIVDEKNDKVTTKKTCEGLNLFELIGIFRTLIVELEDEFLRNTHKNYENPKT